MVRLDLSPPGEHQMRRRRLPAITSENWSIPRRFWQPRKGSLDRNIDPVQIHQEVGGAGVGFRLDGSGASRGAADVLLEDLPTRRRLQPAHDAVAVVCQVRYDMGDTPAREQARRRGGGISEPGQSLTKPRV